MSSGRQLLIFRDALGNNRAFDRLVARESMPGPLGAAEMERFVRNSAVTYWHQTCS